MFDAAMLNVVRSSKTRWRPRIWSELKDSAHGVNDAPPQNDVLSNLEKTWIAMMLPPRATPWNVAPLPAAMPATWVPW